MERGDVPHKVSPEAFWVPLNTSQSRVIIYLNNRHALSFTVSNQSNTEEEQTKGRRRDTEREKERERKRERERQRDRERELFGNSALSHVCRAKTPPGTYLF